MRLPSASEPMALHLFANGIYEPLEHGVLRHWCEPGGWFIDVGANVGLHSIPLLVRNPELRVLALAPVSKIVSVLQENVREADVQSRMTIERIPCAAVDGLTQIYVAPDECFGMSSLAALSNFTGEEVPMRTLDSIIDSHSIEKVVAIKVDVEGAEALVFEGAKKLLSGSSQPPILFEFCDWAERNVDGLRTGAAQRVLRSLGYTLFELPQFLAGGVPLVDILETGSASIIALPQRMCR